MSMIKRSTGLAAKVYGSEVKADGLSHAARELLCEAQDGDPVLVRWPWQRLRAALIGRDRRRSELR